MIDEKDLKALIDKKQKKEGKFSKRIVFLVIFLNVIFASAVLYVFFTTSSEPTALVTCWFGFTTIELWELSKIKRNKNKKEEKVND